MKSTSITSEVKRMTEKLQFVKIEAKGFQDICDRLAELERETERQSNFIQSLKLSNSKLTLERNRLCDKCNAQSKELQDIKKLSMFEFGNLYCSSESLEADGHALARSLGVGL
jgi:predicted nuclease with TOPRIM domain